MLVKAGPMGVCLEAFIHSHHSCFKPIGEFDGVSKHNTGISRRSSLERV